MNCPVCHGDRWERLQDTYFNRCYVFCESCGAENVLRLHPIITSEAAKYIYESHYHENMVHKPKDTQIRLMKRFGVHEGVDTALELGPGNTDIAAWLLEQGAELVDMLDINPTARDHYEREGYRAAAVWPDLQRTEPYDLIYSWHYIEHVANIRVDLAIQAALARRIFFCIPTGHGELYNPEHNWLLSRDAVLRICQDFGTILVEEAGVYGMHEYREEREALHIFLEVTR